EGKTQDWALMPVELGQLLASAHVVDRDLAVGAGNGQGVPICGEGEARAAPRELATLPATGYFPYGDRVGALQSRQVAIVRRHGECHDWLVDDEVPHRLAAQDIPVVHARLWSVVVGRDRLNIDLPAKTTTEARIDRSYAAAVRGEGDTRAGRLTHATN